MSAAEAPRLEDYISAVELADYLGISVETLTRLHGLRSIPLGKGRVYAKSEVAAWLQRRRDGSQ